MWWLLLTICRNLHQVWMRVPERRAPLTQWSSKWMFTNVFLFNFIVWSCFEVKIEGKKTCDYRLKCSKDFFLKNGSLITFGVGRNAVLLVKLFKTVIIWLRHFFFLIIIKVNFILLDKCTGLPPPPPILSENFHQINESEHFHLLYVLFVTRALPVSSF